MTSYQQRPCLLITLCFKEIFFLTYSRHLAFHVLITYIACMLDQLTAPVRQFFSALADVVFGNPFTPQRDQLIVRLAPSAPLGDLTSDREALARVVGSRLEPWMRL